MKFPHAADQSTAVNRTPSWILPRVLVGIASLLVAPAPAVQIIGMLRGEFDLVSFSLWMVIASACGFGGWFALCGHQALWRARIKCALAAGLFGFIFGFVAGFFGPVFLSKSNTGPLLGIFVTGPLGFPVGALLGAVYGWIRNPRTTS